MRPLSCFHRQITVIIFVVALPASLTWAQGSVTFGGSAHYPPFHFFSEQGVPVGFDVDVFKEVAAQADWAIEYQLGDWEVIQQSLSSGLIDIAPMFVSQERKERYLFSEPINIEYHLLFGFADSANYNGIDSLSGLRIAAERGAFATMEIVRLNDRIDVIGASSEAAALDMVLAGEADLALLPSAIGWYSIRALGIDTIVAISPPILPATYAFAISPDRPELVNGVNSAILQMQRENTLEAIRQRWLVAIPDTGVWDALRRAVWVVTPLVLAALMMFVWLLRSRGRLHALTAKVIHRGRLLRETQEKVTHFSSHDSLTELPNRRKFTEQLRGEIELARKSQHGLAVAVLGLHNLDTIQDAINDDAGEELIRKFSYLLQQAVPLSIGYLGMGQFALLLRQVDGRSDAFQQLLSIIPSISQSLEVAGMIVHVQVSGGLAVYPEHAQEASQLIQQAKLALSSAMKSGSQILLFTESMKPDPQKLQLISDLRVALSQNQLQWALQPQYSVKEKRILSSEMLVRWHHSDYGWVPPDDFVVWAEQMGKVSEITRAGIAQASWILSESADHNVSLNLSANDLADTEMVERIIDKAGANLHRLTLEITETALMYDVDRVQHNVNILKQAGAKLSLDDYGTGYSSLEYLKAFSFDEIKIDRMFINDITRIDRNLKLTRASIELGHNLGANVVAEGVEDKETADLLIQMGCDILQGYFIGRPQMHASVAEYTHTTGSFKMT